MASMAKDTQRKVHGHANDLEAILRAVRAGEPSESVAKLLEQVVVEIRRTANADDLAVRQKARAARRAEVIKAAIIEEMRRLNLAAAAGKTAILDTAFGKYVVESVDADFWVYCYPLGAKPDSFNRRSFALCNDGRWEDLLKQAGVKRSDLWSQVPPSLTD